MSRVRMTCALLAVLAGAMVSGCATWRGLHELRHVDFQLDRVDDARLAGVDLDRVRRYEDIGPLDVARLAAAVLDQNVPLEMKVHVRAENPAENRVDAELTDCDWALFIEDREAATGEVAGTYVMHPGQPIDVPVTTRLDLYDFAHGSARDLIELALALEGYGDARKEIRVELSPRIQTALGPIRYPGRIVLRREIGSR